MKLKKVLLQIGLLLAFVGVGVIGTLAVQAASIPAGAQAVNMTDGHVYNPKVPGTTVPDSDNGGFVTGTYPQITAIAANNIDPVTKRITSKTTKIYILFSGNMIAKNNDRYTAIYPQVMMDGGVSVASTQPKSVSISGGESSSVRMPATYQEVDVDLSNLANKLPLYVGVKYTVASQYGDADPSYYFGTISADATASEAWKAVTINDGNDMASASTVVKGTGEPGLTATLSGVSGSAGQYSTTIGEDGTYSIDLGGSSLKDLGNPSTIKVTESNDLGDSNSTTANVVDTVPLTTTAASSSVAVDPDTLSGNITGKSDAEILAWLSGQSAAGLTTTKEGSTTALTDADGLTYTADATDLASKIATATAANPLTINVSASDSAGDKTTATTPIKIYTTDGTFKFNSLSDFAFGTLPVPAQETLFAPTNTPSILIDDTQTVGKDWYVTANATKMTDSASNELNGDMVYVDADGAKHNLTNTTTLVGQGQRESGKTTAEVADGWANAGATVAASKFTDGVATGVTKGVYLDAHPNIYTGGVADGNAYTGAINWTLTNSVSGS